MCGFTMTESVLLLADDGDFYHYLSYEAEQFKFKKNCQTKNETPACAKSLLAVVFIVCHEVEYRFCYHFRLFFLWKMSASFKLNSL